MSKIVPLHALVMVIQNDHSSSVAVAKRLFSPHEVLTPEGIILDLVGQRDRPDLMTIAVAEMRRRMALKLSLGERVVVISSILHRSESRLTMARDAINQGAAVLYLLADNDDYGEQDTCIKSGDGLAQVAKVSEVVQVAKPMPDESLTYTYLRENFRGLTILGDVHGVARPLQDALSWARSRRHFAWFLGDVIDYGTESLQTMEIVYSVVMRGEGAFMLGNHERKIARWLAQQESGHSTSMRMSDGNRVTINALNQRSREDRIKWCGKFRSVISRASLISHLGDITMVHAAVHPDVWMTNKQDQKGVEDFALYGEPNRSVRPPDVALSYRWVDAVPAGKTVFVGHDVRSTMAPVVVTGHRGGRVIFLDTGAGKGGPLSTADLRFTETGGLHLENFNRY